MHCIYSDTNSVIPLHVMIPLNKQHFTFVLRFENVILIRLKNHKLKLAFSTAQL